MKDLFEPVCPLDFRYGRDKMKRILSHPARVRNILKVEAALLEELAEEGLVPPEAAQEVREKATLEHVSLKRVEEIEGEIRHDLMAVVKALTEVCRGDAGRYIHLGVTSYDIIDTAIALQLKDALDVIEEDLKGLIVELARKAKEHRETPMIGRTHGQHAVPITLGLKLSVWTAEFLRHLKRLEEAKARVLVGKMSGATGTGAALKALGVEDTVEFERRLLEKLGLGREEGSTQIVQRDRFNELISLMANISTTVEKVATEIRTLQRTEIGELYEVFDVKSQVGSSTMAHKRNPITLENITGLARMVRANLTPTFESSIQWNERDLANSSAERFTIPHTLILTDDILVKLKGAIGSLGVDRERMLKNLYLTKGAVMAEALMIELVKKGYGRQEAHEVVRRIAMRAQERDQHMLDAALKDGVVGKLFGREELAEILDPLHYIGDSARRCDEVIGLVEKSLGVRI
ncbi:MAG: adenylosuccinate lyase [Thermoplasmata archaeon]|nr:MAG: adenylosuccinate lyase [Thermoplasmata archaeon]HDD59326.1 adenylosuccinate lyase [Euryarchaeota archaeon]